MSLLLLSSSSPKHCAKQHTPHLKKLNKKLIYGLSTFFITILALLFIIWLIIHPTTPHFYVKDTSLINTTILATLVSQNPNTHFGVYYDHLRAHLAYRGQSLPADAVIPPFYQGHGDAKFISVAFAGSQAAGQLLLGLKLDGQLRWKMGTWVSGRYGFKVDCVAVMGFGTGGAAAATAAALSSVEGTQCSTSV